MNIKLWAVIGVLALAPRSNSLEPPALPVPQVPARVAANPRSQPPLSSREMDPDEPGEAQELNRQIWEYMKKTPYEEALKHIAAVQREGRAPGANGITLPTGWSLAPAGTQVGVGRLPYEAIAFAGQIVVLNTGYYYGASENPQVSVVDPANGQVTHTLKLESLFPCAQVGLDGDLYISGGVSQKLFRLNDRFETVRSYAIDGYVGGFTVVDASHIAVSTLVSSGSQDDFKNGRYQQGRLLLLNTQTGAVEQQITPGYFPYAMRYQGGKLYVTLIGEDKLLVYDARLTLLKTLTVGHKPQGLCAEGDRLYVVNSGSDSISVVDTRQDRVVATFHFRNGRTDYGVAPASCAVSHDALFVTQADTNSVAVLDRRSGRRLGAIPTGWFPTKVLVDGGRLLTLSAKGILPRRPNPQNDYVLTLLNGSLGIVPLADLPAQLTAWTRQVEDGSPVYSPQHGFKLPIRYIFYIVRENRTYDQVMGDLPGANGDAALTQFGQEITPNGHQLAQQFVTLDNFYADGEISVLGHSFTTSGYASPFLEWLANMNYSGRYAGYPFGTVPAATSPSYLWDALDRRGLDYRIYGENYFLYTRAYDILKAAFGQDGEVTRKFYAQMMTLASVTDRGNRFYQLAQPYYGQADTPDAALRLLDNADFTRSLSAFLCGDDSLAKALGDSADLKRKFAEYLARYPFNYRSWDLAFSDLDRVKVWRTDFQKQLQSGHIARLSYLWLPNDHTAGSRPGLLPPDQFVAQNDAALAAMIDTISHSPIWKESLILITEDDAQNGADHVDATRTVALAIGPYVKRKAIVSDRYDQLSLLRTIEMLLGLRPLNQNDALAAPMFSLFTAQPDLTPYTPVEPSHLTDADRVRYRQLEGGH